MRRKRSLGAGDAEAPNKVITENFHHLLNRSPKIKFAVEYATTVDMLDGQPLPPYIDDDVVWHAVCPIPGARMLWRRIRLSSETLEHAIDRRPVALTFNAWRQSRHQN
jgi:hypothetical protein